MIVAACSPVASAIAARTAAHVGGAASAPTTLASTATYSGTTAKDTVPASGATPDAAHRAPTVSVTTSGCAMVYDATGLSVSAAKSQ